MKKIIYMLFPFMLLAGACNEGSDFGDEDIVISDPYFDGVESATLQFSRLGGMGTIQVKTNLSDWTVTSDKDWCTVERVSWSDAAVKVTVKENELSEPRHATVTLTSELGNATVTVSQAEVKPEIVLGSTKIEGVERAGNTVVVTVNASVDYTVVVPDWITVNENSTEKKVYLDVTRNGGKKARTGAVRFVYTEDQSIYSEVTVSQDGAPYHLTETPLTEDRIYSNIQEKDEGRMSYLLDGSTESGFFHSIWSGTGIDKNGNPFAKPDAPHYLVVDMETATDAFTFTYSTRGGGRNNGCPSIIKVYGSNAFDYDNNWTAENGALKNAGYTAASAGAELIATFNELPTSASTVYVGTNALVSGVKAVKAETAYRYIWIEVAEAKNWENSGAISDSWAMSELKVLPLIQED